MVLANIEDAMMSGASLYELKAKIEAYPKELEHLYWHLVHLIQETDRKWAFSALKMAQFFRCSGRKIECPEFWGLSLLELSFLDDSQHCDESEPRTINENLETTYRKVYGRCKGFLQVCSRRDEPCMKYPAPLRQEVVLIHRSIVEFIDTPDFANISAPYISAFDCFDNACSALVRCTNSYRPFLDLCIDTDTICSGNDGNRYCPGSFWTCSLINYLSLAIHMRRSASSTFISFLDSLRGTFLIYVKEIGYSLEYTSQYFALIGLTIGSSKFVERMQEEQLGSIPRVSRPHEFFSLFCFYGDRGSWAHVTQHQFIMVMTGALYLGTKINHVWKTVIHGLMANIFPLSWCPGVIIDWCLRHGADPDQAIGELVPGGPRSLSSVSPNDGWQILHFTMGFRFTQLCIILHFQYHEMLLLMNETSDLYQGIKKNGGVLKVRDLLGCWYPNNRYFPNLIDELHSSSRDEKAFGSEELPSVTEIPLGAIHGHQCEEEYKQYFGKDVGRILDDAGANYQDLGAYIIDD
ncbi:hypothetical protein F5Y08DRAFT_209596 [Xylaria arbuscula]|nr:hypothetical protein F5Y08DRAFT_209596 [Xylaria arbuscula]